MESPSAQRQITSFFANVARKGKQDGGVILKGTFLSDDVVSVEDAGPATESTFYPTRKRKSPSDNIKDLEDFGLAAESTANPPKRQRRQTAKEKAEEEKAAALNVQESFPEPRGEPEVWADVGHSARFCSSTNSQPGPPESVRVAAILSGFQVCRIHWARVWIWLAIRQ